MIRRLLTLLVLPIVVLGLCAFFGEAQAQMTTGNSHVTATVQEGTGWIWFLDGASASGPPSNIRVIAPGPFTPDFVGACDMPIIVECTTVDTTPVPGYPSQMVISRTGSFDGSICNARCIQAIAVDLRKCMTCVVDSAAAIALQNMRFTIDDSVSWKFSVCVIDSIKNGSATVVAFDGTGQKDTAIYTYCTIADTLPPLCEVRSKYDTAFGPLIVVSEERPWDHLIDTIIVTKLMNLRIDATSPKDFHVGGLSSAWISLLPDGHGTPASICITAIDRAGNRRDTCFTFGQAEVSDPFAPAPLTLDVYPNPGDGEITIRLGSDQVASVEILDVLGRQVGRFNVTGSREWDMSELPAGSYVVRAKIGEQTVSRMMVKR